MMERIRFNEIIQDLDLIEILMMDRKFTWSNIQLDPSLAKLDRIYPRVRITTSIVRSNIMPQADIGSYPYQTKFRN